VPSCIDIQLSFFKFLSQKYFVRLINFKVEMALGGVYWQIFLLEKFLVKIIFQVKIY
jgi:hypothetical protein